MVVVRPLVLVLLTVTHRQAPQRLDSDLQIFPYREHLVNAEITHSLHPSNLGHAIQVLHEAQRPYLISKVRINS